MSSTPEDIRRRLQVAQVRERIGQVPPTEPPTATSSFINEGMRMFNTAAFGIPRLAGDVLAGMGATAETIADVVTNPMHPIAELSQFGERFEQFRGTAPVRALRSDALNPTAVDVEAALKSAPALLPGGESPGEAFSRNKSAIEAQIQREREEHPIASTAGTIAGGVGAVVAGRNPLASGIRRAEKRLDPPKADMFFGTASAKVEPFGAKDALMSAVQSPAVRRLLRGAGRAVETGAEAAFLESVSRGEDPLMAASVGAGGQMVGSGLIQTSKGVAGAIGSKSALLNVSVGALLAGSGWQLLTGGWILPDIEAGFDKARIGLILGATAAIAGAGRPGRASTKELTAAMEKIQDGLATFPRAAVLSGLRQLREASPDEQQRFERVSQALVADPEFFGRGAGERLGRAYRNGTALREIDRLMKTKEFSQQMARLNETGLPRPKTGRAGGIIDRSKSLE